MTDKKEKIHPRLGMRVRDIVNGIEGIVDQYHVNLFGLDRVSIQPPAKDGKVVEGWIFDHTLVEVLDATPIVEIPTNPAKFELGETLKCKITGKKGAFVIQITDLGGCNRCGIIVNGGERDIILSGKKETHFVAQEEQFELMAYEEPKKEEVEEECPNKKYEAAQKVVDENTKVKNAEKAANKKKKTNTKPLKREGTGTGCAQAPAFSRNTL